MRDDIPVESAQGPEITGFDHLPEVPVDDEQGGAVDKWGRPYYAAVNISDEVKITGAARLQNRATWCRAEGVIVGTSPGGLHKPPYDEPEPGPSYLVRVTADPEREFKPGAVILLKREEFLTPGEYERAYYADFNYEFAVA